MRQREQSTEEHCCMFGGGSWTALLLPITVVETCCTQCAVLPRRGESWGLQQVQLHFGCSGTGLGAVGLAAACISTFSVFSLPQMLL